MKCGAGRGGEWSMKCGSEAEEGGKQMCSNGRVMLGA